MKKKKILEFLQSLIGASTKDTNKTHITYTYLMCLYQEVFQLFNSKVVLIPSVSTSDMF